MALNIPLFDGWRMRSDNLNIILERLDNETIQEQYFYGSIQGAIEGFLDKKIKRSDASTIEQLNSYLNLLYKRLSDLLAPLDLGDVAICALSTHASFRTPGKIPGAPTKQTKLQQEGK